MKRKRFLLLILPIVTLFLEIVPYGAVCNFARPATDGTIGYFRELYSYFDLLPFGYANFAPFLTAVMTCIVLLMLIVYVLTGSKRILEVTKKLLYVCIAFSLGPVLLGVHFLSVVGVVITLLLAAEGVLVYFAEEQGWSV